MPNVTITVSDQLKIEMEKLPEVNWSEVCRNAINQYIQTRSSPVPQIQLMSEGIRPFTDHESGYPGLLVDLVIKNNMNFEIVVDRILYTVKFFDASNNQFGVGSDVDLWRRVVRPNSVAKMQLFMKIPRQKVESLKACFTKTFQCRIKCVVFANEFQFPYEQEIYNLKIPIDEWTAFVGNVESTNI